MNLIWNSCQEGPLGCSRGMKHFTEGALLSVPIGICISRSLLPMLTSGHGIWKGEEHFGVEVRSLTIQPAWFWITLLNRIARGRKAFYSFLKWRRMRFFPYCNLFSLSEVALSCSQLGRGWGYVPGLLLSKVSSFIRHFFWIVGELVGSWEEPESCTNPGCICVMVIIFFWQVTVLYNVLVLPNFHWDIFLSLDWLLGQTEVEKPWFKRMTTMRVFHDLSDHLGPGQAVLRFFFSQHAWFLNNKTTAV